MKKIITAFAIICSLFSISAQAQREDRLAQLKQQLKDSLQFSDVVADSVVAVQKDFGPKTREIFMNQDLSREDKQAQILALNEQKKIRLKKAGLTDEQVAKLDAWQRSQMRNRFGGGGRPGGNN